MLPCEHEKIHWTQNRREQTAPGGDLRTRSGSEQVNAMENPPSTATQKFIEQEPSYGRFRRALRRSDQLALDDLFNLASQHLALAQYAPDALPFELLLLSMLLEEHKEVERLRQRLANAK